mmetsp:Transcript_5223/g.12449  ORF Transcript_5223/g.12449 Transcript_5223/m.12449 type:complete len:504 (-) Transcript_5223:132-1643(-)|eukprot:CAMPEP_0116089840 /NCGR_PEP_ID=MMETSP0327-20121206/6634_1 /TAXON_ID=44447 /ORGANISM="Pseudo-nitzschia delicatissima, Strain B596" /LENGTH=503 /DNA_ID=CAMNT_0003581047 /DNA_START=197 /DNA_END=1708 /DNA_ORIENTATION=-
MKQSIAVRVAASLVLVQGMVPRHAYTTRTTSNTRIGYFESTTQLDALSKPRSITTNSFTEGRPQQQRRSRKRTRKEQELYHEAHGEEEEDYFLAFEVDSFQELQRSTGSEILDHQLQSEIDRSSPELFLDTHVADASYLEKVAMSSVPEQLPQPAINAFRHQQQKPKRKGDLDFATTQKVTPEEEIELAKMIQRGVWLHKLKTDKETAESRSISRSDWAKLAGLDSATQLRREVATYRRAKQLLVSANMGLVHTVVKKNYYDVRRRSGTTFEELVQEGSLGLLRAAELFDPSRGIRFSTYATIWIKGTLSKSNTPDGLIKLPAREKTKWNKIVKAHRELVKEKGGIENDEIMSTVSVEEIANRLDMRVEDVIAFQRKMKQAKSVLSLDYEYQQASRGGADNARGGNLLDTDTNMQADADLAERAQMQADVIAAMARNLTPREARLMRLRYGLTTDGQTRTIQECADAMGVSQARASQLAKACLKKLREAADVASLEEYLLTIA